METLTVERAHELLKRAVAEKGEDYVYPYVDQAEDCVYFHPETREPACIVGHVVHYLGFGPDAVREGMSAGTLLARMGLAPEGSAVSGALNEAQECQDGGNTWGEALQAFETYAAVSA